MIELKKANFEEEILKADKPVLIGFGTSASGSWQKIQPVLEEIAQEYGEKYKICTVDVDDQAGLAFQYQIMDIPAFAVMRYGICAAKTSGVKTKEELLGLLCDNSDGKMAFQLS